MARKIQVLWCNNIQTHLCNRILCLSHYCEFNFQLSENGISLVFLDLSLYRILFVQVSFFLFEFKQNFFNIILLISSIVIIIIQCSCQIYFVQCFIFMGSLIFYNGYYICLTIEIEYKPCNYNLSVLQQITGKTIYLFILYY